MYCIHAQQNSTRLFNVYGITEVSSWATCHEITDRELARVRASQDVPVYTINDEKKQSGSRDLEQAEDPSQDLGPAATTDDVPLGTALPYTEVEVRSNGDPSDKRVGSIWLGRLVAVSAIGVIICNHQIELR